MGYRPAPTTARTPAADRAVLRLLRRIARRCDTHDRYSYAVTARLERALGMEPSPPPASLTDTFSDPRLIDCGHAWCRSRQP